MKTLLTARTLESKQWCGVTWTLSLPFHVDTSIRNSVAHGCVRYVDGVLRDLLAKRKAPFWIFGETVNGNGVVVVINPTDVYKRRHEFRAGGTDVRDEKSSLKKSSKPRSKNRGHCVLGAETELFILYFRLRRKRLIPSAKLAHSHSEQKERNFNEGSVFVAR